MSTIRGRNEHKNTMQWRRQPLKAARSFSGHQSRKAGHPFPFPFFRSPFFPFLPLTFPFPFPPYPLPLEVEPLNPAIGSWERCKLP